MAVAATNLTADINATGGTSGTTASITPAANKLVLITITERHGSVDPGTPTVTGCGLTWVQIASDLFDNSGSQKRVTVLRAMGASPTTGVLTMNFSQTLTDFSWAVDQFTGMDTSGTNGSGAIVQAVTKDNGQSAVTSFSLTMGAFGSVNNATYGVFGIDDGSSTFTPGSGFSTVSQGVQLASEETYTEFEATNNSTVATSWTNLALVGGIGIEIKAATVVGGGPGPGYKSLLGVGQ